MKDNNYLMATLDTLNRRIGPVRFSPDGKWIAGGGVIVHQGPTIVVWPAQEVLPVATSDGDIMPPPISMVSALRFSNSSNSLAYGLDGGSVLMVAKIPSLRSTARLPLITTPAPRSRYGFVQDSTAVGEIAFSDDDNILAAGCWDRKVKIWDLTSKQLRDCYPEHSGNVEFVTFMRGSQSLLSGTWDCLRLWNVPRGNIIKEQKLRGGQHLWRHAIMPNKRSLLSVGDKGKVRIWDLDSWKFKEFELPITKPVNCIAISPSGHTAAIGTDKGLVYFMDLGETRQIQKWKVNGSVNSMDFSPKEDSIVLSISGSTGFDVQVRRWTPGDQA